MKRKDDFGFFVSNKYNLMLFYTYGIIALSKL